MRRYTYYLGRWEQHAYTVQALNLSALKCVIAQHLGYTREELRFGKAHDSPNPLPVGAVRFKVTDRVKKYWCWSRSVRYVLIFDRGTVK